MKLTVAETHYTTIDLPQQVVDIILDYVLTNHTSVAGAITWLNKKGQITVFPKNLLWDISKLDLDTETIQTYCRKKDLNFEEVRKKIR